MKKTLLLLFISLTCFSQAKINYKKSDGLLDITPYISYMADSSEKLTFEQVRNLPASAFIANNKRGLNMGNTEIPYWFRIDFEKNKFNEDLYVFIESPEVRILDVYIVDHKGNFSKFFSGTRRAFASKYIHALNYIIKISPQHCSLYYKISTKAMFLPTYLGTLNMVFKYSHLLDGLYYAMIGLMFALTFYNLFLFFSLKDRVFLYYSIFVLCSLLNIAKAEGMVHELLWFDEPFLILNENNNFFSFLTCFSIYFFTTTFLNTRIIAPVLHKILKLFCYYFGILIIFEFLPYWGWVNDLSQISIILYGLLVLFSGYYTWWLGYTPAKYFAIAWTFYIIGIVIILLSIIGLLPMYGMFWMNSWKYGQIVETLIMAFAVAYRFNLFRKEARDAQELVLQRSGENEQLLLAHNQILEEKLQLEEKISNQKPNFKVDDLLERLQSERGKNKKLAVSTIEGVLLLPIPDIIRLEALGSYCNIYLTNNKKIIASKNLAEFEPMLDKNDFLRIHKSHIVNVNFIERYIRGEGGMVIMPDGAEVSVSRTMKAELLEKLNIS